MVYSNYALQSFSEIVCIHVLILQELLLKYSVDALGYAVVAGIVAFSHADWHLSAVEDGHVCLGTVLQPLVGVMNRSVSLAALLQCHAKSLYCILMTHVVGHRPANYLLRVGVGYEEQVMKTLFLAKPYTIYR